MLSIVKKLDHPVVSISATRNNSLARFADGGAGVWQGARGVSAGPGAQCFDDGDAGDGGCAVPVGDEAAKFTSEDFAILPSAGNLGRKLIKVSEAMSFKMGENLPVASERLTVGDVLRQVSKI